MIRSFKTKRYQVENSRVRGHTTILDCLQIERDEVSHQVSSDMSLAIDGSTHPENLSWLVKTVEVLLLLMLEKLSLS